MSLEETTIRGLLSQLPLFEGLDSEMIDEMHRIVDVVSLPGGQVLMRQGEPGNLMYIVRYGRLGAFHTDRDGCERLVGDIGPGETIGEMALLTDELRAVTVRALRDCQLILFSRAAFERLVGLYPQLGFRIARTVIRRLQRTLQPPRPWRGAASIAVTAAGGSSLHDSAVDRLALALGNQSDTVCVRTATVNSALGDGAAQIDFGSAGESQLLDWLHRVEGRHGSTLYVTDANATAWTRRCLRQADLIVLIGTPSADPALNEVERAIFDISGTPMRATSVLVLAHSNGQPSARTAASWLDHRPVQGHHHVSETNVADWERIARQITGRAVGVVLSGGGARGFAHLGVLKALEALHIPVDCIGGVSFGASVAGAFALGWDFDGILREQLRVTMEGRSLLDFTPPFLALTRGARLTRRMRNGFRDVRIEDLWRGFFAVSSNLSTGQPYVHHRGPLWQAVRASVAIPGIFPPVRSPEGHVLADGSLMNNLPVDVMRDRLWGGRIIAVHTGGRIQFSTEDLPEDGIASGWRLWFDAAFSRGRVPRVPRVVHLLTRAATVGSALSLERQAAKADVLLQPPVEHIDLLAFHRHSEAIEAGYRHTLERLAGWRWDHTAV